MEGGPPVTAAAPPGHTLQVMSAMYEPLQRGPYEAPFDALPGVSRAVNGQQSYVFQTTGMGVNQLVGCDPYPNRQKALHITFNFVPSRPQVGAHPRRSPAMPSATVAISEDDQPETIAAPPGYVLRVRSAVYEPADGLFPGEMPCNVTASVSMAINGRQNFTFQPYGGGLNRLAGMDPFPNRVKTLNITYDMIR